MFRRSAWTQPVIVPTPPLARIAATSSSPDMRTNWPRLSFSQSCFRIAMHWPVPRSLMIVTPVNSTWLG